jgi:thiol-disulfide isomerase/thioredoxin
MIRMTKSIFTVLLTIISLSVYGQGIEFVEVTWQEAVDQAKQENKLLFVDSYAKWCGPCKKMAKHEFVKPEVGEIYNANFINLKLDMETPNGRTFDSKYPVSAYPTMFFLNGDGEVVQKIKGGKKAEQLIDMANKVLKSYDTSGQYKELYDKGDRSYDVVYNFVKALNSAGKPSLRYSNNYLKYDPDITEEQKLNFYYIATVDADSKIFDNMVDNKDAIIKLLTAKKFDEKVKSACIKTVKKAIEFETESLMVEAVEKSKKYLTEGAEEFSLECKLKYYSNIKNNELYEDAAKSLSKIYLKSDPSKLKTLIADIQSNFKQDKKLLKLSTDLSKKYHKKTKTQESTMIYAKSLMLMEKYDDATDVLSDAIKKAQKNGEATRPMEMFLKVIEKKKA